MKYEAQVGRPSTRAAAGVDRKELVAAHQPQMSLRRSGLGLRRRGAVALAHHRQGMLLPAAFIPLRRGKKAA